MSRNSAENHGIAYGSVLTKGLVPRFGFAVHNYISMVICKCREQYEVRFMNDE